jgi:class 3 adenylate cyclase
MDYERLPPTYRQTQTQRLQEALARVSSRPQAAASGRVVPGDTDLALGTGRRLGMAVMFIDLCGFSGRPAESAQEQEVLLRVFDFFFTEMIRIAEDYGGTVEKNTGDGLMAYFEDGGGTPAESGAKRAVACALTMMDTTAWMINPVLRNSGVQAIEFRVGIDCGTVTVAKIGAAKRFGSLVAIGTTANVACKMLDVAEAGEILIGAHAFHRLPAYWQGWCRLRTLDTGWIYRLTGLPYPFYQYTGRWAYPLW